MEQDQRAGLENARTTGLENARLQASPYIRELTDPLITAMRHNQAPTPASALYTALGDERDRADKWRRAAEFWKTVCWCLLGAVCILATVAMYLWISG